MKEIVGVSARIGVPAQKAWDVIASIGGMDKWSPLITSCRVEGSGAGAKRYCTMSDGAKLNEVIDEVDNGAMRFRYRITEGLLVERFEGTIIVKPAGEKASEVTWYGAFVALADQAEGFRQMIREAYKVSINGLEKHCQN